MPMARCKTTTLTHSRAAAAAARLNRHPSPALTSRALLRAIQTAHGRPELLARNAATRSLPASTAWTPRAPSCGAALPLQRRALLSQGSHERRLRRRRPPWRANVSGAHLIRVASGGVARCRCPTSLVATPRLPQLQGRAGRLGCGRAAVPSRDPPQGQGQGVQPGTLLAACCCLLLLLLLLGLYSMTTQGLLCCRCATRSTSSR